MSPHDEDCNSYFAIDAHYMGRIFFTFSTCLTLAGLYFAAHPFYLEDSYNSNRTLYVIQNYQTYPNGSMFYEFIEEDGSLTHGDLGTWFNRLLKGEYRYFYGNSFWNYCKLRTVPDGERMTSILRSMNHLIFVQVFLRAAVLLTMTHSLFQCLLINFISKGNYSPLLERMIGFPLITVEFVHNISLFTVTCLHYEQDAHIFHFTRIALILLTVTTVLKLIFVAIMQSNQLVQVGCVLLASAVILSHNLALDDFDRFLKDPYCDSMTFPSQAFAQLVYFLAFFVAGYLQYKSLEGIRLITCSTQEELDHQKRFCVGSSDSESR